MRVDRFRLLDDFVLLVRNYRGVEKSIIVRFDRCITSNNSTLPNYKITR